MMKFKMNKIKTQMNKKKGNQWERSVQFIKMRMANWISHNLLQGPNQKQVWYLSLKSSNLSVWQLHTSNSHKHYKGHKIELKSFRKAFMKHIEKSSIHKKIFLIRLWPKIKFFNQMSIRLKRVNSKIQVLIEFIKRKHKLYLEILCCTFNKPIKC